EKYAETGARSSNHPFLHSSCLRGPALTAHPQIQIFRHQLSCDRHPLTASGRLAPSGYFEHLSGEQVHRVRFGLAPGGSGRQVEPGEGLLEGKSSNRRVARDESKAVRQGRL